jgi:hypothetical protein
VSEKCQPYSLAIVAGMAAAAAIGWDIFLLGLAAAVIALVRKLGKKWRRRRKAKMTAVAGAATGAAAGA